MAAFEYEDVEHREIRTSKDPRNIVVSQINNAYEKKLFFAVQFSPLNFRFENQTKCYVF